MTPLRCAWNHQAQQPAHHPRAQWLHRTHLQPGEVVACVWIRSHAKQWEWHRVRDGYSSAGGTLRNQLAGLSRESCVQQPVGGVCISMSNVPEISSAICLHTSPVHLVV